MTEYRYKAFISYSHSDERWAAWLHKALESYRVPRHLVGSEGRFGQVPARVAPVFRDREDLSSAADLTATVREELAASETLVVVCSPAAAASHWANEEIKYFKSLGRAERIITLIVDGDPTSADPKTRCFPPALLEGTEGETIEPLGADIRDSADGKALARLKLVAGILGLRLDDLRQRDMQRKHRLWMFSAGGAFAIAILTSVLAVMAITARDQAETRRQHAEDLVDYMVDDLKEKLDEVGRLDILEDVGAQVSQYLETLNPQEESEESLLQKAKVLRQLGEVGRSQGKLDDSMRAFQASRDVTGELLRRNPQDEEQIFEMGQAEFWVGYVHLEKGEFEDARHSFDEYLKHSIRLTDIDPENTDWIMEQSYAHSNIAALISRQKSGDVGLALEQINKSVELNRKAMELSPDNQDYISEYGEALAWQADTQLMICDLEGALQSRMENVLIARTVLEEDPVNVNRKQRVAWSIMGLANVMSDLGKTEDAIRYAQESAEILSQLVQTEGSNAYYLWSELYAQAFALILEGQMSGKQDTLDALATLHHRMKELLVSNSENFHRLRREWVLFLLRYSEVAWVAGEKNVAKQLISEVIGQLEKWIEEGSEGDAWQTEINFIRFLVWHFGLESDMATELVNLPDIQISDDPVSSSCQMRRNLVLQSLIHDDQERAQNLTERLIEDGFREASFIRVCEQYDLCKPAN